MCKARLQEEVCRDISKAANGCAEVAMIETYLEVVACDRRK